MKWAVQDSRTARYAYRVQFNVPRVPEDKTDELTEYEFDYELLLRQEYHNGLIYSDENDNLSLDGGNAEKGMRTDPVLYQELKGKIERGEDFDFVLPDDSNLPRLSQVMLKRANGEEQVDPSQVFGGGVSGGP